MCHRINTAQVIKLDILKGFVLVTTVMASHLFQVNDGRSGHCSIAKDVLCSFLPFHFQKLKLTDRNMESLGTYKSKQG